ncbi:zinc ABC transporter substrate-binding protein [Thiohalomonas denitrificans]|uniref:zinc ABC transporter substrate-binding protein n=1 Tax=Thiohalomonas denitrificans TaxID=415747 RepID=UPI0026F0D8D3|nr:zinc ABC transporter substrate-binding protein [Thiohalomonas denitrificans]
MKRPLLFTPLLLLAFSVAAKPPPKVVASIAPIHSLVASVTGEALTPELLMPPGSTPHSYALRPSGAGTLAEAELVIWIGENLESVLAKPLASLGAEARKLGLMESIGVSHLPARRAGIWAGQEPYADSHGHGNGDPHLWLAPANARAFVDAIATVLAEVDPERKALYRANADRTRQRIDALESDIRRRLEPVKAQPYLVFHDAYQHFEQAFELGSIGAIVEDPEHHPGARRLAAVRQSVRERGVRCVFSEPQFRSSVVDLIMEGSGARHGVLDPVGSKLSPGPDLWFELMENLTDSLVSCLAPE